MMKAKQTLTHTQNSGEWEQDICTRTRLDLHRHWPPAANGHHSPLSLSAPAAATNRQGYPGSKAGFVYWTNHHHMANVVARGVSSYMYCMYARDSDGHPLPLGRGGEWWWWVGRGLMTDEEPVQVANWLGSVQSIHRTSHLMAAMADYTAYFLPHVEKKGPVSTVGSFTCPCPPLITLSVTHHHHHRREEKRRVRVRPAAHACISLEVGVVQTFYKFSAY